MLELQINILIMPDTAIGLPVVIKIWFNVPWEAWFNVPQL